MQEKIYDEWNKPEVIEVNEEEYYKLLEDLEYCKKAIGLIKDELKFYLQKQSTVDEAIDEIGIILKELEDEIN